MTTDPDLRALDLFEQWLEAPDRRAALLANEPPAVLARFIRLETGHAARGAMPTELPAEAKAPMPAAPEQIGTFKLTERIGQGGMGDVWRGERIDGLFEQTVAIKLIQSHLDDKARTAFDAERRILARLTHPGIVRLIDGGLAENGLPYLIMDYVEGAPLDQAASALPLTKRIALMREAAAAVQFAHGRLVAHADLKPSNIMVDSEGHVRLLDFGIAGLLSEDGEAKAPSGAMTRAFASSQRLAGAPPSIADDVYALGKVLNLITEDQADPDLQAIITTATAEEEADRYPTVAELDADLARWQVQLPVSARGSDWRYRTAKFMRRNWKAVAAAAVLCGTALLTITSLIRAEQQKLEASARFDDARGTARYLLFTLYDQLQAYPNTISLRREVAATAQQYLNRLAKSQSTVPEVKIEAAQGLLRLAQIQGSPRLANLGQTELVRANLNAALALVKGMNTNEAILTRASIYLESSDLAEFVEEDEAQARGDLELAKQAMGQAAAAPASMRAAYYVELSIIERWSSNWSQARAAASQAVKLFPSDNRIETLMGRTEALRLLGDSYSGEEAFSQAAAYYQQSAEAAQKAVELYPKSRIALHQLGTSHYNLGKLLVEKLGKPTEGLALLEQSLREKKDNLAREPEDDTARRSLRIVASGYQIALTKNGRVDQGLELMQADVAELKAIWQRRPGEIRRLRDYAVGLMYFADLSAENQRIPQACTAYDESKSRFEEMGRAGRLSASDRDEQLVGIIKSQAKFCTGQTKS